ncbi:hypothetical protein EYF80_035415 [Liparis tanakae]|uniref:Uncharacterized protein n=1 Tax=Liparis tanakae TaxID=230148 RepID=A0A4Z2GLH6_9TELE|nr:hypothetical protein EYF80_035415 [Liparis tanakae]
MWTGTGGNCGGTGGNRVPDDGWGPEAEESGDPFPLHVHFPLIPPLASSSRIPNLSPQQSVLFGL